MSVASVQIGNRITRCRESIGMTAASLAIQADMTAGTLSFIENGRRDMKIESFCAIAKALRVSLDQLQPEELDEYSAISPALRELIDAVKKLPVNEQSMMIRMFLAQIGSLEGKI